MHTLTQHVLSMHFGLQLQKLPATWIFFARALKMLFLYGLRFCHPIKAWIEPLCVGTALTSMPLFLTTTHYIPLPLEKTYTQSWVGVPDRWKRVIQPDVLQTDVVR